MLLSTFHFSNKQPFNNFSRAGQLMLAILLAGIFISPITPNKVKAQSDTSRWTVGLQAKYKYPIEAQISPDGDHIAYEVIEPLIDETTSKFRHHIYVTDTEGTSQVQYTRGKHNNFHPRWSPDGRRIAFISDRGEKPQVYLIRLRGGEAYPITDAKTGVDGFQWSPDGERIAYLMKDPKSKAEKKREMEKRDVNMVDEETRYKHLYTTEVKPVDDTTRKVLRITKGSFQVMRFDWSPDGNIIVFAHQNNPGFNALMSRDISTVPSDSGRVKKLVEQPGYDGDPRFAPSGKKIAFTSNGGKRLYHHLRDVYTISDSGGAPEKMSHTPDRRAEIIGWTAGSKALLVSETIKNSIHILTVPANGDPVQRVTQKPGVYINSSYKSSSDQLACIFMNSNTPMEVVVSNRKDFSINKITRLNKDVPKPQMGKTKQISWKGKGGKEIEGLLTFPVGYEKGDRVPLITYVHGGPAEAHYRYFTGPTFFYMIQAFAQNGYAVLRPNPRGSTGYGKSFRSLVVENIGPGPFQDIISGIDKTIDMKVAHPDSLAITGGSYGGYMTAYAVTQTNRFKAASIFAGYTNLISKVGTTDIPNWSTGQWGGEIWNNYETYEKLSPIYHIDNVNTPTQVLHGTEDKRVPTSQGREFYRALKRQGIHTEMVLYPRSSHGIGEPKLLMDLNQRMIDWFDKHLDRERGSSESQ